MKTVQVILVIAVCLLYCSIDTIAQLQEIEEIAQLQEIEEIAQLQEVEEIAQLQEVEEIAQLQEVEEIAQLQKVDDFEVQLSRFIGLGLGVSIINADTKYGNYGCSYNMDLNFGFGLNKWEVLSFIYFGRDKTESDLIYLDETWAAGSPYYTLGLGVGFRYRLFDFGKISLSPNIGVDFFDMGPKHSDLKKYPGLRKFDSGGPTVIDLGVAISHLIANNSRFYKVSLEYSHLFDTKYTKFVDDINPKYANDIKGNINKLTLRIIFIVASSKPQKYRVN